MCNFAFKTIIPYIMVRIKEGFAGSRMLVLPVSVIEEMEQDPFASALHLTDIGYYPHARHHYRRREKGISQYILIFCRDGRGWVEFNGNRHLLLSNQFIVIPAYTPHAYGADDGDPWTIYWLHFKGTMAPYYGDGFSVPCSLSASEGSRIGERLALFEEIYRTLELGYGQSHLHYALSALYHLLGTFKYVEGFRQSSARNQKNMDVIDRCRHYMLENIEQRISLQRICEFAGYSESYCTAVFKKQTGLSPVQYLQHLRIQNACRLLNDTDLKINQICCLVGIPDPYYFSRIFSKTIGLSPAEYRRSNTE